MLVTFRSNSFADITMFGDVAEKLLKMMAQSGQVPGAILAQNVPAALASLQQQLEKIQPAATPAADSDEEAPVGLATRAQPLIQLLEASIAGGADVILEN